MATSLASKPQCLLQTAHSPSAWDPEWWLWGYTGLAVGIVVMLGIGIVSLETENTRIAKPLVPLEAFEAVKQSPYPNDFP